MTPRCACGQPAPNATICHTCASDLELALRGIPGPDGLAYHLGLSLARQTVTSDHGPSRGHATPLPYDPKVSDVTTHLAGLLWLWATALGMPLDGHTDAYVVLPPMTTPARWLAGHMGAVSRHSEAATIVAEAGAAITRAWEVIGHKPPPRVYAGPCPQCATDLLTAPGRPHVTCTGCGTVHDIQERQDAMRTQLDDYLGTAVYAAAILPGIGIHVSAGTIRVWASRHRLEVRVVVPAHPPSPEQHLFRLGDIIDLAVARDARAGLAA